MPISAPQPQPVGPTTVPFYGTLEIPAGPEDDGPRRRRDARSRPSTSRSSAASTSAPSSSRSRWRGPTSSRPTCGPTPSSIRTASSCSTRAPARSSAGRPRAGRASLIPTSPIRSTFRTNVRRGPWLPPVPSGSWRRCTRMPSASGSTTFTAPTSRPWRLVKRSATPSQSVEGWSSHWTERAAISRRRSYLRWPT